MSVLPRDITDLYRLGTSLSTEIYGMLHYTTNEHTQHHYTRHVTSENNAHFHIAPTSAVILASGIHNKASWNLTT